MESLDTYSVDNFLSLVRNIFHHIPGNMDGKKNSRVVFSGGINWDSREPIPPQDDDRAAGPGTRDERPRRPHDVATLGSSNSSDSRHSSATGHGLHGLNSAGARTGQHWVSKNTQAPRLPPNSSPLGLQVPPNTASIYFSDNSLQERKNVVSEFGRGVLTPLAVEVAVFVVHNIARMTVTHIFYNDLAEPIEKASHAFPVPSRCTLTDFSYRIGSRKVVAVVKPAAQARENFAKAVSEKRIAALLEQDQDDSEIITTHLGNIPGETEIKTELELVLPLERRIVIDEGAQASVTTLTIPATMAGRYGGSVSEVSGAPHDNREGISIRVDVVQSPELQGLALRSPSHRHIDPQLRTRNQKVQSLSDLPSSTSETRKDGNSVWNVVLEDKQRLLDKDFVLEIKSKPGVGGPAAQAWLGQHTDPELPKQHALMIHIPTSGLSSANHSERGEETCEIVFMIDQSNSMDDKIGPLVMATRFLLLNIPPGWKFNIYLFGSTYTSLWPSSKKRDEHLEEALEWLAKKCRANRGGSEVIGALKAVLKNVSCQSQVLLLTDGQIWRLEQTLQLIEDTRRKARHPIRFFCLGIGDMTPRALVEGLANSGGGYCDVIYFRDQRWKEKLVAMLASILAVYTHPIQILLNGKVKPDPALQSPGILSRLNVLQEENIFLLIDSNDALDIARVTIFFATDDGEDIELDIPVHVLDNFEKNDTIIHKLAARALLEDLKHERSAFHMDPDGPSQSQSIEKRAEKIACEWKLLSKWTSFIMTDQQKCDGLLVPAPASGSALMQTRLLTRIPKIGSRFFIEALAASAQDDNKTPSSDESVNGHTPSPPFPSIEVRDFLEGSHPEESVPSPPPPPPVSLAPPPRPPVPDRDEIDVIAVDVEPSERSVSSSRYSKKTRRSHVREASKQTKKMVQEELYNREKEQRVRKLKNQYPEREYEWQREYEWRPNIGQKVTARREAEEYVRRAEERARRYIESLRRDVEDDRVRRETEKRDAERDSLEAERRARDEELRVRKEAEIRREFRQSQERLAQTIAELSERVTRKEADDREAARKEAQRRARREEEALRRAEWEGEKMRLEREIREAAMADAERHISQTAAQTGQRIRYARPVEGHVQEGATPQTGNGVSLGGLTFVLLFFSGFMFLSSWIIALSILRI